MFSPALIDALYAANVADQRRRDAAVEQNRRLEPPRHDRHHKGTAHRRRRWPRRLSSSVRPLAMTHDNR